MVLVALPSVDIEALHSVLLEELERLPRATVTRKALENSKIVQVQSKDEALAFSNAYAPEHLIINTEDADQYVEGVTNAGSVFLGKYTPESVGDYASGKINGFVTHFAIVLGTNHVLPTYGCARMYSGVSLDSFLKKITVQTLTLEGLQNLGPTVEKMAQVEALDAHKRAVSVRLQNEIGN